MNQKKCEVFPEAIKVEEEEEEKPDIVDCAGSFIEEEHINEFVTKLQRYEIDKLIEHIDEKVMSGDFCTKMSPRKVIDEIKNLTLEDPDNFNMKRYAVVYNIVDSFGKVELDIFLQVVETKIEEGLVVEENSSSDFDDEFLVSANHSPTTEHSVNSNLIDSFFQCHICSTELESVEKLEQHVEEAHFLSYCCSICDQKFEQKLELQKHIKQVHCAQELEGPEDALEVPERRKHSNKETSVQEKQFVKRKVFIGSNLKCDDCSKVFGNAKTLERHSKRFHNENSTAKVLCDICNTKVNDLKTHMKSHEEKKFQCDKCPKRYRTKFDLKTHTNSVHLGVKETCPHCGKLTANLSKHIYGNHMHEFPCEICGRIFARQTQLNYHLKAHERGTIIQKATPDVLKEKKRIANHKYLAKKRERQKEDKELHEHEKTQKRAWARKNREKLIKYKREYYEKKREEGVKLYYKVNDGGILTEDTDHQ